MQTHVKVLGALYLAVSAIFLALALFLIMASGTAAGIVGAAAEPEDAAVAIPLIGIAGTAAAMFLGVFALPGLLTGYGLLQRKSWARIVGIVLSAISLLYIPIGTVIGIYGLWVLLSKETEPLFDDRPVVHPGV